MSDFSSHLTATDPAPFARRAARRTVTYHSIARSATGVGVSPRGHPHPKLNMTAFAESISRIMKAGTASGPTSPGTCDTGRANRLSKGSPA
ncbi:hypothetical protein EVAR_34782_1 [Eumeta japonica]|uniref:Uncharacterized protein n=1 Tax=Eumeta variegata TaxID=151549 RepID=A0A4C1ZLH3_EUMVA|nr:hypothetical protein EVAR_34782_1 [Eumeta japonica]